jgi:hypothetical protein
MKWVPKSVSEKKRPREENYVNPSGGKKKFLKESVIIVLGNLPP